MDIASFPESIKKRVALTISCTDCKDIPKFEKAGQVEYDHSLNQQIQYMFNGIKIVQGCYHGDWMTYIIAKLKGHHEPQEEKVFYEVLKRIPKSENNIIMELGAFWSYYSMWFVNQVGGKAILVEPNSEKLEVGLRNFNINNLSCASLNGFISSYCNKNDVFIDWDLTRRNISRYSVDYLIKHFNVVHNLTMLHSDIQGAEFEMLSGSKESLKANKIDYIFISTHNGKHEPCLGILLKYNYHIIASHEINESVSADGLIVASSPQVEKFDISISKV